MTFILDTQEFLEEITQDFEEDSEHVFTTDSTNVSFLSDLFVHDRLSFCQHSSIKTWVIGF